MMDEDLVQLRAKAVESRNMFRWFNSESDIQNGNVYDKAFILECSPSSIINLIDNFETTESTLQKAIALHQGTMGPYGKTICINCDYPYPCKTLRILTGEDNG